MSETKIVVPAGMLKAVSNALAEQWKNRNLGSGSTVDVALEAALRWLAENPIVPTDEQLQDIDRSCSSERKGWFTHPMTANVIEQWQCRMFLAPEPEVTEAVRDLLWVLPADSCIAEKEHWKAHNEEVLEAYRRGQKAGEKCGK